MTPLETVVFAALLALVVLEPARRVKEWRARSRPACSGLAEHRERIDALREAVGG